MTTRDRAEEKLVLSRGDYLSALSEAMLKGAIIGIKWSGKKRPVGRPKSRKLHGINAERAWAIAPVMLMLGENANVKTAILLAQYFGREPRLLDREETRESSVRFHRLFPNSTTIESLETSVSRGKRELGLPGDWHKHDAWKEPSS
ncbi:hypothetical protein [uncultured Litoreibacter sp.]|uniref:hypothetical protein n=1 Tax=uncultured Litoreibacter sp. TaxID=1392394 RepID=UPI00261875FE|nr:hypothetical protein [uncultured Litoreibacter sp.]